jgi:hypothetical protein
VLSWRVSVDAQKIEIVFERTLLQEFVVGAEKIAIHSIFDKSTKTNFTKKSFWITKFSLLKFLPAMFIC